MRGVARASAKTLGIVGGIAPPSTVYYYRRLTAQYRARTEQRAYPSILINSIDGAAFLELVSRPPTSVLVDYLVAAVERLAGGGAQLALFASNTPHVVFDEVARQAPIQLISIVEATAAVAQDQGFVRLGLIGAGITMERDFYPRVFARIGASVVIPEAADRHLVNDRYFGELVHGTFRAETRTEIASVVSRMVARDAIEAVILGGTELPLLFRDAEELDLPALDTTAIHVDAAVDWLLAD